MRTEAPEEALVCVNLDIKSIKKKKVERFKVLVNKYK